MHGTSAIEIPSDILDAAGLTARDAKLELAVALFANRRLSMGRASELAELSAGEFQLHLGSRYLGAHYTVKDALQDKAILAASSLGMIVVANGSLLMAMARIGRLDLLRSLFGQVLVPDAVWREVVEAGPDKAVASDLACASLIERRTILDLVSVEYLGHYAGTSDAEAVVLARETNADCVLMDEWMVGSAAESIGLTVVGLVGVLMEARERGLIEDADEIIDQLHHKAGFWISEEVRRLVTG